MTKNTPNESMATRKSRRGPSPNGGAAERRRQALQAFLDRMEMTAADLARTLGLSTANLVYNHLHGRSGSLSLPIIEAILDQFEGLTFEELTGRKSPHPSDRTTTAKPAPILTVLVDLEAVAGLWRRKEQVGAEGAIALPFPAHATALHSEAFGVRVGGQGAEDAYPAGSILLCRRLGPGERLVAGHRVVVNRFRDDAVETTIREVAVYAGDIWLMSLSTHPEHQVALQVPRAGQQRSRHEGPGFRIEGVVAWAWIPQPGTTVPTT